MRTAFTGSSCVEPSLTRHTRHTARLGASSTVTVSPELPGANTGSAFPWTGTYFNNVPITLTAVPKPGYRFVGWTGVVSPTATASITLNGSAAVTAIFIPELPAFSAMTRTATEVTLELTGTPDADYTLQSSTDLVTWTDVAVFTPDINTGQAVVVHPATDAKRFYRAVSKP